MDSIGTYFNDWNAIWKLHDYAYRLPSTGWNVWREVVNPSPDVCRCPDCNFFTNEASLDWNDVFCGMNILNPKIASFPDASSMEYLPTCTIQDLVWEISSSLFAKGHLLTGRCFSGFAGPNLHLPAIKLDTGHVRKEDELPGLGSVVRITPICKPFNLPSY